ncbi:MAG: RIP metalloprotease RseP [Gammaproteobacteria bacterium]
MMVIQSILAFILVLGLLITFHEYGHYWVARRCNVKILRFSVGFGRPLWKKVFGEDETELVIAALPLGGYVKMLDEREGEVPEEEKHRAFNNQTLARRFAIVSAGPIFNFIFAVFAYWIMFMTGVSGLKPIIGEVAENSPAMHAGVEAGQEIIRVDGRETPTWGAVVEATVSRIIQEGNITYTVIRQDGSQGDIRLDLSSISIDDMAEGQLLNVLGLVPKRPVYPAVIGELTSGGAADTGGLLPGDEIVAVDGKAVEGWTEWVDIVRSNPGRTLNLTVRRADNDVRLSITPERVIDDGETIGRIGAAVRTGMEMDASLVAVQRFGPVAGLYEGMKKTWEMSLMTLRILGKMIVGEASVKNLSGPITIAHYAGQTASIGLAAFLGFIAIVSVSLGVLNLLPVPVLDGGHLLYYLVEFVKGSPVSEDAQLIGQQVGIAILLGLMSIAFYNDIVRLIN